MKRIWLLVVLFATGCSVSPSPDGHGVTIRPLDLWSSGSQPVATQTPAGSQVVPTQTPQPSAAVQPTASAGGSAANNPSGWTTVGGGQVSPIISNDTNCQTANEVINPASNAGPVYKQSGKQGSCTALVTVPQGWYLFADAYLLEVGNEGQKTCVMRAFGPGGPYRIGITDGAFQVSPEELARNRYQQLLTTFKNQGWCNGRPQFVNIPQSWG